MENMDKELAVPKWVLIVQLKIAQMSQNLSAQFVCPIPKVLDFNEKRLHWASVVRVEVYWIFFSTFSCLTTSRHRRHRHFSSHFLFLCFALSECSAKFQVFETVEF